MDSVINHPKKKSYTATSMRAALQKIQQELGDDAIILSSHKVQHGVCVDAAPNPATIVKEQEIINEFNALMDKERHYHSGPDASILKDLQSELSMLRHLVENQGVAPSKNPISEVRTETHNRIQSTLLEHGFAPDYCQKIVKNITEQQNFDLAMAETASLISKDVPVSDEEILDYRGAVALVGPTGVGKTTTIAKLAARFVMRYDREQIGLITSDFYRVAGREQLRIYGKILDIPIHMVNNVSDLEEALVRLQDKRLILIDTAGVSPRDARLTQKLNLLQQANMPINTYLVFSATSQSGVIKQAIDAFRCERLVGAIMTKLDESTQIGHALSVCIEEQLPLTYVSNGQSVPEDLKVANSNLLVQKALNLQSKIKELKYV